MIRLILLLSSCLFMANSYCLVTRAPITPLSSISGILKYYKDFNTDSNIGKIIELTCSEMIQDVDGAKDLIRNEKFLNKEKNQNSKILKGNILNVTEEELRGRGIEKTSVEDLIKNLDFEYKKNENLIKRAQLCLFNHEIKLEIKNSLNILDHRDLLYIQYDFIQNGSNFRIILLY